MIHFNHKLYFAMSSLKNIDVQVAPSTTSSTTTDTLLQSQSMLFSCFLEDILCLWEKPWISMDANDDSVQCYYPCSDEVGENPWNCCQHIPQCRIKISHDPRAVNASNSSYSYSQCSTAGHHRKIFDGARFVFMLKNLSCMERLHFLKKHTCQAMLWTGKYYMSFKRAQRCFHVLFGGQYISQLLSTWSCLPKSLLLVMVNTCPPSPLLSNTTAK